MAMLVEQESDQLRSVLTTYGTRKSVEGGGKVAVETCPVIRTTSLEVDLLDASTKLFVVVPVVILADLKLDQDRCPHHAGPI